LIGVFVLVGPGATLCEKPFSAFFILKIVLSPLMSCLTFYSWLILNRFNLIIMNSNLTSHSYDLDGCFHLLVLE